MIVNKEERYSEPDSGLAYLLITRGYLLLHNLFHAKRWLRLYNDIKTTPFYTSGLYLTFCKECPEHKEHKFIKSFTERHNCEKLVWYCNYSSIVEAIIEEKN